MSESERRVADSRTVHSSWSTLPGLRVQGLGLMYVCHWEGYRESRRRSRDTYPESYITWYTSITKTVVLGFTVQVMGLRVEG